MLDITVKLYKPAPSTTLKRGHLEPKHITEIMDFIQYRYVNKLEVIAKYQPDTWSSCGPIAYYGDSEWRDRNAWNGEEEAS